MAKVIPLFTHKKKTSRFHPVTNEELQSFKTELKNEIVKAVKISLKKQMKTNRPDKRGYHGRPDTSW
ncbi:MAG: hypothetical protein P4L51_14535 [Puia sp.]|nr:hypothetical protein [Puia sp.]